MFDLSPGPFPNREGEVSVGGDTPQTPRQKEFCASLIGVVKREVYEQTVRRGLSPLLLSIFSLSFVRRGRLRG
jgi:hypothetical protein